VPIRQLTLFPVLKGLLPGLQQRLIAEAESKAFAYLNSSRNIPLITIISEVLLTKLFIQDQHVTNYAQIQSDATAAAAVPTSKLTADLIWVCANSGCGLYLLAKVNLI